MYVTCQRIFSVLEKEKMNTTLPIKHAQSVLIKEKRPRTEGMNKARAPL